MARGRLWSREEVLLALDLLVNRPPNYKTPPQADIDGLARLLGRSPGSVGRKVGNLQSVDPTYGGKALPNIGSLEEPLFHQWASRPKELRDEALRIRMAFAEAEALDQLTMKPTIPEQRGSTLYERLKLMTVDERRALVGRLQQGLLRRGAREETHRRREVTVRCGQGVFAVCVLADYFEVGQRLDPKQPWKCPGCGHDRVKANGEPVLEAHHVVPFSETDSMDPRWGIPLCNNCHELLHFGSVEIRREVYTEVLHAYPVAADHVKRLDAEGLLKAHHRMQLKDEGLLRP